MNTKKEMELHKALGIEEARNKWNKRYLFIAMILWGMITVISTLFFIIGTGFIFLLLMFGYMALSIWKITDLKYKIRGSAG